ncbi:hypothetical protein SLEP1_g19687 [Rubroshorea leprosula]|uniref:Uncharacterized protein n=1 Tax=Rubroshorea leprosula TaxID=152421 RepID=A0AAV5J957_9ROSI|nr:hypothetical protein SLEP1_g19687 [Rubroshorea leprosula]
MDPKSFSTLSCAWDILLVEDKKVLPMENALSRLLVRDPNLVEGMDPTSTLNPSSRYVHYNEGSMELDGGNHRLGNMEDQISSKITTIPLSNLYLDKILMMGAMKMVYLVVHLEELSCSMRAQWEIVEADGSIDGIWLIWDNTWFNVDIFNKGPQVIHALVKVNHHPKCTDFNWFIYAVYNRPQFNTRCLLWENLTQFSQIVNEPWLAIGDFNDIISQSEKFRGNRVP